MDERFVQINYSETTEVGDFTDALYIPLSEYSDMTEQDITDLKTARKTDWVAKVKEARANAETLSANIEDVPGSEE